MTRFSRKVTACSAIVLLCVSLLPDGVAQTGAGTAKPLSTELTKYPGLLPEFGRLLERLKHEVQLPPTRYESKLLSLLPAGTTYFAAFPNFGEAAHQALGVFRDEVGQSSVLNGWWRGEMAQTGPQLEDAIEKFYQISRYLGDEVVISGEPSSSNPRFFLAAEVKKPGLDDYLRRLLKSAPDKSKANFRVLNQRELKQSAALHEAGGFVVLVRPDFVVAGPDLEAISNFNSLLDAKKNEFASAPFGQRLAEAYQAGTETLGAADLHTFLSRDLPANQSNRVLLNGSGFNDLKYLVWNHKKLGDEEISESELSFTGPRRSVASWLVSPGPLQSLDFVSPKALIVVSLLLKNFGEIFDDVRELSTVTNPNGFAAVSQIEQSMHINLKDDLLSQFSGEVAFELNEMTKPQPAWKVIFRVNDPVQLQKTLDKLLMAWSARTAQFEQDGTLYHSVILPSSGKTAEITYTFVDSYLVMASSRGATIASVKNHQSGETFANSTLFLAPLPAGYSSDVSALFYEDAAAIAASAMRQLPTQETDQLSSLMSAASPVVLRAYGENTAIRGLSAGASADPTMVLILAAIAIPNLLRARTAANESTAVATIRSVNVAQATYSAAYPQRRYAPDLASLGPNPAGSKSPEHAGLLDNTLGNSSCTAGKWCDKNGYHFTITATCKSNFCSEFVVLGTPFNSNTGTRNFCSTSDAIIRYRFGAPLLSAITPSECKAWAPVQ